MNRQAFRFVTVLGLFLMLAVASVQAQTAVKINVHVPFDFIIGEARFSAGQYSVSEVSQHTLLIRSADGRERTLIQAPRMAAGEGRAKSRLVFRRYGDQYFLSQAWLGATGSGHDLRESNAERMFIRMIELSDGGTRPQTVEVAANGR
ncbi:MAG TPA: hypothetical protein VNA19_07315 [Pyrinomonadaceae bacterium]|jgi:hypothetical protein|nr:hypothetical protein [Pyrinomonadaceae bacterium]